MSTQQKDNKTQLQELLSARFRVPIPALLEYKTEKVIVESGTFFRSILSVSMPESMEYQSSMHAKKKDAEQQVAKQALSDISFKLLSAVSTPFNTHSLSTQKSLEIKSSLVIKESSYRLFLKLYNL